MCLFITPVHFAYSWQNVEIKLSSAYWITVNCGFLSMKKKSTTKICEIYWSFVYLRLFSVEIALTLKCSQFLIMLNVFSRSTELIIASAVINCCHSVKLYFSYNKPTSNCEIHRNTRIDSWTTVDSITASVYPEIWHFPSAHNDGICSKLPKVDFLYTMPFNWRRDG